MRIPRIKEALDSLLEQDDLTGEMAATLGLGDADPGAPSPEAMEAPAEKPSVLVENTNLTSAKAYAETEAKEWVNPDIETVPTEDTTRFSVAKKTTKITKSEATV